MLRILKLAVLLALVGGALPALAVGSKAITSASVGSDVTKYTILWTSDGSGDVTGDMGGLIGRGYIFQVEFVPGTSSVQPSDAYDITLLDSHSVDILNDGTTAGGANLSNATSKALTLLPAFYYDGTAALSLIVDNAGVTKQGTVMLWVRPAE